jgi:hypothetical protein
MDLETAKQIFAVWFYRWALQDFAREAAQGLPMISSIKGETAQRFIEIWESLSAEEREILSVALVKRVHPEACALTGEFITSPEQCIIERYLSLASHQSELGSEILGVRLSGQGPVKTLSRSKCAAGIKRELKTVLGNAHSWKGAPNDFNYHTRIGPWLISTHVRGRQPPSYFHRIIAAGHVYLHEGVTNVLSWLGIGGLVWDLILDDDDAAGAAISMAVLCAHFINGAPKLLEGLSHDVPEEVPVEKVEDMSPRLVKRPRLQ